MEKMLKRLLCAAVVLAMVLSWLPGGLPKASAAEADPLKEITNWVDWDGTTAISGSGNYRLTRNVTLESNYIQIKTSWKVNLDLNSYTLTAAPGKQVFRISGTLSVTDLAGGGMITGGQAVDSNSTSSSDKRGGNIYINNGTLNLYGGTIIGGQAVDMGGNIYSTGGTVNIAGGTVSGGITEGEGGNIALMHAKLNLSSGTVSGGSANTGGNIYATGYSGERSTVTFTGGVVEDVAEGSKGRSIYATGAAANGHDTILIISGGTLYGETYAKTVASCTISGAPVIEDLRLGSGMLVTPSGLTEGASITVQTESADNVISGALKAPENSLPYFSAYQEGYGVGISNNRLVITEGCPCGCGQAVSAVQWQKLSYEYLESQAEKGAINVSGHYYLEEDLTLTQDVPTLEIYDHITLDLRGKTITPVAGSRTVYVNKESTFTLMDTVGSGTLDGGTLSGNGGGAVYVATNAAFHMYGGTVNGGTLTGDKSYGGAIYVADNGTFVMHSGTVTGGSARQGGNIYTAAATSTVKLLGGTVSGGTATGYTATGDGRGGNIYMKSGEVTVSGSARVTGGHAKYDTSTSGRGGNIFAAAGTLIISGSARISGGIADKWAGNIMFTGANVTVSGSARITGGKSGGDNADNIINMYGNLTIAENAVVDAGAADGCGTSILITGSNSNYSTFTVSGGTLRGVVSANSYAESITLSGSPVIQHLVLTASGVLVTPTELQTGASITVEAVDSVISGTLDNAADCARYFHAYAEGYTVAAVDNMLQIVTTGCPCGCEIADGQVDWQNWTGGAITTSGHYRLSSSKTITSEVSIASGLEVTIDLFGKTLTASGCRTFLVDGTLNIVDTMGKGKLAGSTVTTNGGNIYLSANTGAVLNLYGGTITGGTGHRGGNVYVSSGAVFNMYDGTVSDGNTADNGTTVSDNRGGNIYVEGGTFRMYGGTVSGGHASRGGNIGNTGTVWIYGGTVSGGDADWGGGNIFSQTISNATHIAGGTITGGNRSGIYLMYSSLYVSGGTVEDAIYAGNSSTTTYSAVYISGGTVTGAITDSNGYAGDTSKHTFVISGGTLSSVTLTWTKTLVLSGAPAISNMTLGGGVVITPVELSANASVTLTAVGAFTTAVDDPGAIKACFTTESGSVAEIGNTLAIRGTGKTCGTNVEYLLVDKVLSIAYTGTGSGNAMSNYSSSSRAPWYSSGTSIQTVVIREGVTSVGNYALNGCSNVEKVTIADTVTSVGNYAFNGCSKLKTVSYQGTQAQWKKVSVGSGNTYLTNAALTCSDTSGTSEIVGGGPVTNDMIWSFSGGTLTISGSTRMPNYYYDTTYTQHYTTPWAEYADQITAVKVTGMTTIGSWAFADLKNLTSVTIGTSVQTIGNNAFRGCTSLETINIKQVEKIEHNAFHGCTALQQVTADVFLSEIHDYAFYGCESLTTVSAFSEVSLIGDRAFLGCTALTDGTMLLFPLENGALYDEEKTVLIHAGSVSGSFTVPEGVTRITDYAFAGNTTVTNIVLPNSVTAIGAAAFEGCTGLQTITLGTGVKTIGTNAFANCDSLTAITVAEGNATYASDADGVLYSKDMTTLVQMPGGITGSYTVAESVTAVGERAFAHNSNLTAVVLPGAVTSVGKWAFSCDTNLTEVTIPAGVTSVKSGVFEHTGLTDVYYVGQNSQWAKVSVAGYNEPLTAATVHYLVVAQGTCGDDLTWVLTNDGVLTISGTGNMKDYADYAQPWYAHKTAITSVVIGEGVTSIGTAAFSNYTELTEVTIPKTVTVVGANAFAGCTALTAVNYGGSEGLWSRMTIGDGNEALTGAQIESTPATPTKIQVKTLPEKLDYTSGETLDTTGLVLLLTYDDTTTAEITEGYEASCEFSAPGAQTVTVTYGKLTTTYEITVTLTGTCGTNLTWTLTGDGKLTITGTGAMTDYTWGGASSSPDTPWANYLDKILSVEICDGVTTVGRAAFWKAVNLTSVRLPEGITTIGAHAFRGCGKLESVDIPSTVKTINSAAFYQCSSLTSVELPDKLTALSTSVFGSCTALKHVTVGSGVSAIQSNVFSSCSALQTITYHGSKTKWEQIVAEGAVPETVAVTFTKREAVSITVDATNAKQEYLMNEELDLNGLVVTVLYDNGDSEVLESGYNISYDFTVSGTVTVSYEGKEAAFEVAVIPAGACGDKLTWVLKDGILTITGTGAMADYSAENAAPWAAYADRITALAIGDEVTTIGAYVFSGCTALMAAAIPESVTVIGEYAFDGCSALESALYGGNASKWASVTVGDGNEPLVNAVEFAETLVHGDADGSGEVNTLDATAILKYLAGWDVTIDKDAADADGSGEVNTLDATAVLKYLAGWDVTLG